MNSDEALRALDKIAELRLINEPLLLKLRDALRNDPSQAERRIRRAVARSVKSEYQGKWVCSEIEPGRFLWVQLGQPLDAQLITGTAEPEITGFVLKALRSGGTFVDVGANMGWLSIRAGSWYHGNGGGRVVSIEPNPELFGRLCDAVRLSALQEIVTPQNVAIGDEDATLALHITRGNVAGSYVLPEAKAAAEDILVASKPASSLLSADWSIDLIKIDIEGAEPSFFRQAGPFLRSKRPAILSEVHAPKLRLVSDTSAADYLISVQALGYDIYMLDRKGRPRPLIDPVSFSENAVENVLFVAPHDRARFGL